MPPRKFMHQKEKAEEFTLGLFFFCTTQSCLGSVFGIALFGLSMLKTLYYIRQFKLNTGKLPTLGMGKIP